MFFLWSGTASEKGKYASTEALTALKEKSLGEGGSSGTAKLRAGMAALIRLDIIIKENLEAPLGRKEATGVANSAPSKEPFYGGCPSSATALSGIIMALRSPNGSGENSEDALGGATAQA